MEGKHGTEYVNGMMGNERIIHKEKHHGTAKSMVGGTHIDLVQRATKHLEVPTTDSAPTMLTGDDLARK